MLWLFGQIWLWLIVSFALGAVATWLLMRAFQRQLQPQESAYEPFPEKEPDEVSPTEQTQFIPAPPFTPSEPLLDYRFPDEPYDQESDGHREGRLPMPPPRPAPAAEDWPTEEEPVWPAAEDLDATRRWPGRSG